MYTPIAYRPAFKQLHPLYTKINSMREHFLLTKESVRHEFRLLHQLLDQQEQLVLGELDQLLATFEDEVSSKRDVVQYLLVAEKQLYPGSRGVKTNAVNNLYLEFQERIERQLKEILNSFILEMQNISLVWRKEEFLNSMKHICKVRCAKVGKKVFSLNLKQDVTKSVVKPPIKSSHKFVHFLKWSSSKSNTNFHNITDPFGIAIDNRNKNIIVADSGLVSTISNESVKIYSPKGKYLSSIYEFAIGNLWGLCIDGEFLYITCEFGDGNFLYQFNIDLNILAYSFSEQNWMPRGLSFYQNSLYVCDKCKNYLRVFSSNLHLKNTLKLTSPYIQSSITKCYDVEIYQNILYVLFENSQHIIQTFALNGEFIFPIILQQNVRSSYFFTISSAGTLLISDTSDHNIKLFTIYGMHIGTIGSQGFDKGQLFRPCGIAANSSNSFVVVDEKKDYALQCFEYYHNAENST